MSYLLPGTLSAIDVCFFKQKTAYEMRISDWSSDVCSSDLEASKFRITVAVEHRQPHHADRPRLRSAKERAFTLGFRRSIGAGRFDRRGVVDQFGPAMDREGRDVDEMPDSRLDRA